MKIIDEMREDFAWWISHSALMDESNHSAPLFPSSASVTMTKGVYMWEVATLLMKITFRVNGTWREDLFINLLEVMAFELYGEEIILNRSAVQPVMDNIDACTAIKTCNFLLSGSQGHR